MDNAIDEVAALQMLASKPLRGHPHVVPLVECLRDDHDRLYIVTPFCCGGDLFSKVRPSPA
jgi:serine/threonine protein kinase